MLVLEWKVWHPLRYLLTVVFMNKRSEAKRSLKLHFERHPLLFSSWPFLAWILSLGCERKTDVCVFTLEWQEEERTGGEGKWKKEKKNTRRNRERRFPIWSIRHVQSGASCIVPLVHSYPALFPYSTDAHSFCLLAIRVFPSAPCRSASFTRLRSRPCFLRIVFDSCFLRNNRSI